MGRPHGLDGSFYVTYPREHLLVEGATVRLAGRETAIVRRAGTAAAPIVRVSGIDDREAAASVRGSELEFPRAAARTLEQDEWWAEDLEGCRVVDGGVEVGRVGRLLSLPSCDVLEVQRPDRGDLLVPLVHDAVRTVDIDAAVIDIDLAFLGETP